MPEQGDTGQASSRTLRLLLAWQVWVFALAATVGFEIYVLHPEPPLTRGDLLPADIYRRGGQMAREALASSEISPERLGLLLGARTYLSVLDSSYAEFAAKSDVPYLLGRIYHDLGEVALQDPEMARREGLLSAKDSFRRSVKYLERVSSSYPVYLSRGKLARLFQGKALLGLGEYRAAADVLEDLVQQLRDDTHRQRRIERIKGFALADAGIGAVGEDAVSAYMEALWRSGQQEKAVLLAEEFLSVMQLAAYRAKLVAVLGSRHMKDGAEYWETAEGKRVEESLMKPTTPLMVRLGVLLSIKLGKWEEARRLLDMRERPELDDNEEKILRGLAAALSGDGGGAVETVKRLSLERLTPIQHRSRLVILAESGLAGGELADAAAYFQALAEEPLPAAPAEYLAVVGDARTVSIGTALAETQAAQEMFPDAARTHVILAGVPGADREGSLEQAAYLYEQAGAESLGMYGKAATVVEAMLSGGMAAGRVEAAHWRAVDDWEKAGEGLRAILLMERMRRDYPNTRTMPKVLYRLGLAYQRIGLYEKADEAYTRNSISYPRSNYAVTGLLQRARAAGSIPDKGKARDYYLDILADGRLSPVAFPYMAALFEGGILEVEMIWEGYRAGEAPDKELFNSAKQHLTEALERYTIEEFRGYPRFYGYLVEKLPSDSRDEEMMAAASGGRGRPSAWLALMKLYFMRGDEERRDYAEVLRLADLAAEDIELAGAERAEDLRREFLLLKGTAAVLAGRGSEAVPGLFEEAAGAFEAMRELSTNKGDAAWALLAMAILEKSRGGSGSRAGQMIEDGRWEFSRLAEEAVKKHGFWKEVSDWMAKNGEAAR
ncbi:MAG: hypothetical protein JW909_11265 [Planctomycetes bacterium]|nr:hypothetical protein [Planctomycetota bacterium]